MIYKSIWKLEEDDHQFPKLQQNLEVDIAIVGGGITGITAAYLLSQAGKRVAVLEARRIADSSTGYSTGNLYATVGNQGLSQVESSWDEQTMKAVVQSRKEAVDFIEQTAQKFSPDSGFARVPWCFFTDNESGVKQVEKERKAAERAGLQPQEGIPIPLDIKSGFRIDNQAQFNPYRYTRDLAAAIHSDDCQIFENSAVIAVRDQEEACVLETSAGTVRAKEVIMATHTPKGIYKAHTSLGPYREYAIAVRLNGAYPPPGIYWDVQVSEHYSIRPYETDEGKFLLVLGQTHKVGQKEDNEEKIKKLEEFSRNRFDVASVAYYWAAQQYKPADHIPFIGKSSGEDKIYIATGFAADGLTYGTLAALIITDEILGRENAFAKTYKAARSTPFASAKDFIKENVNVAFELIKDQFKGSSDDAFSDVKKGEGKVLEIQDQKVAAYRDDHNKLYVCSAICTHMGCVVHFNQAEKSWDCPCHGSRFELTGEVIEGPALNPLKKL